MNDPTQQTTLAIASPVLILLLGWLLGLLSPLIVDHIRSRHRNLEIRRAILVELEELRFRFAAVVYFIEVRLGNFDRKLLQWTVNELEAYKGPSSNSQLIKQLWQQLEYNDATLKQLAQTLKSAPDGGLSVKKYRIPYVEVHIGNLGTFNEADQARILDVRANVDLFNDEVDEARYYFNLTYQSNVSDENHRRANAAVESTYRNIAQRARIIINKINAIQPC